MIGALTVAPQPDLQAYVEKIKLDEFEKIQVLSQRFSSEKQLLLVFA